jgi:hypothetical protein
MTGRRRPRVADEGGEIYSSARDGVFLAVLMDIRDELRSIRAVLQCGNFQAIPRVLRRISSNTAKRSAKKRAAPRS